jgi:hypothetical protein
VEPSIPTTTVHLECLSGEPLEASIYKMFAVRHRSHDHCERSELFLFAAQQRILFEEGNHSFEKIPSAANDQYQCVIVRLAMILTKRTTTEELPSKVQDLGPRDILADSKLRHELPTASRAGIPLDGYVEASFSVYKTGYVRLQSFLLIDRT